MLPGTSFTTALTAGLLIAFMNVAVSIVTVSPTLARFALVPTTVEVTVGGANSRPNILSRSAPLFGRPGTGRLILPAPCTPFSSTVNGTPRTESPDTVVEPVEVPLLPSLVVNDSERACWMRTMPPRIPTSCTVETADVVTLVADDVTVVVDSAVPNPTS